MSATRYPQERLRQAARVLREQALLLRVYDDDPRTARAAARNLLRIIRGLLPPEKARKGKKELLRVAHDLDVVARLLAFAPRADRAAKRSAAARKLRDRTRDLQAPRKLIAIARRLERSGSHRPKISGRSVQSARRG